MADDDIPADEMSEDGGIDVDQLVNEVSGESEDADLADEWAAAMEEAGDVPEADGDIPDNEPMAAPLERLRDDSISGENSPDLDVILDIPVSISMEVGNTQIPIRNLLQLNQGSVIELDRLAGEPLDVLVNGTLIAHGEVVMVNEKFGIRLTDVVSQQERINRLR